MISRRGVYLALCLFFLQASCLEFSQSTRVQDIDILDQLTLPLRNKLTKANEQELKLEDFLASSVGLKFLQTHSEVLGKQPLLEKEYRRSQICQNYKYERKHRPLSSLEKQFESCLCNPSQPFLHCLAIGSKLLKQQGYVGSIDLEEPSSHFSLIPSEILNSRSLLSEKRKLWFGNDETEGKTAGKECVPHFVADKKQLCFGGNCNVPIGKILDIKIHDLMCTGDSEMSPFDLTQCEICKPSSGEPPCMKLCKDNIKLAAKLIETGTANLDVDVCVDLGRVGVLFSSIFGGDNCFQGTQISLSFYKRVLKLHMDEGHSSFKLKTELEYKYTDGPDCTCNLNMFRCIRSCKMKSEDVIGTLGISWDFFFAAGDYHRSWNEPEECYTEFINEPEECSQS